MIIPVSTISSRRLGQTLAIATAPDGAAVMDATLAPGARVPPHRHLRQAERFEVHSGQAVLWLGPRRHRLSPGDALDVPAGVAHAVRNAGDLPLHLTARLTPGLCTAAFFADLFAEADAGRVTAGGIPGPGAFARLADRYGDDLPWLPVVPLALQRLAARAAGRAVAR